MDSNTVVTIRRTSRGTYLIRVSSSGSRHSEVETDINRNGPLERTIEYAVRSHHQDVANKASDAWIRGH